MKHRTDATSGLRIAVLCALTLGLAGACGAPATKGLPVRESIDSFEDRRAAIAKDPVAFFRESLAAARKIKSLTTIFERQERLGLIKQLRPIERIYTEYRDRPFSVRFTWVDENSEYKQCVFVEGANDGKVLLLPRRGLFGLPPSVGKYDPSLAVMFGKARNPITDFGPRRMIERTLDRIEKARPHGEVKIRLAKAVNDIGVSKEPCYHFEIRYPEGDEFTCKLHDFYISTRTKLPIATWLWLPDEEERSDASLDAMYVYHSLKTNVGLSAAAFRIDPNAELPAHAASTPTDTHVTALDSGKEPKQ